jgi:hypothetical protein
MYKNKFLVDFLARGFLDNYVKTYQSSHVASTEFFTTLDFHSSPPTPDIKRRKDLFEKKTENNIIKM